MSDFSLIESEIMKRMMSRSMGPEITKEFIRRVDLVYKGETGKIPWAEILDLRPEDSVALGELPLPGDPAKLLSSVAVIKLNGGLGTSMGLTQAKSIIPVHDGKNFLQIIREQTDLMRARSSGSIPLIFMNSFNTQSDFDSEPSMQGLNADLPSSFLQNMVPRIYESDLMPVGNGSSEDHYCPPGHGDVFLALSTSGILDKLLAQGRRIAFISNGDNLGATLDERILGFFEEDKLEFAMEITPKSPADLKGGVLFRRRAHRNISLLETAQVEPDHLKDFEDTKRFPFFSINNLYVHLETLRDRLRAGTLKLSLIVNPKDWQGKKILQLEAAMGSACENFENMKVIQVDRDRFAPVKNCSDLLVRRSDACVLRESDRALVLAPQRNHAEPVVKLDDHYKKLADFDRLIPTLPSLIGAKSLTVTGPVVFDVPVRIEGNVKIENRSGNPALLSKIGRSSLKDEEVAVG
ncbi:MAG TPA: UTP--glucose-1-phosphate uridylyltransferase [Leptospiraceae bacterium]|nr:UTP--glucose-1-phosphate uridylyltransferase [Leptospiraceae bacterium]